MVPPGILPATPPTRHRGGFGLKISLGCGALLLLFLFTCGSFTWIAKRQADAAADKGWAQLREPFDRIRDEAGAGALFRESPELQAKFGSEARFIETTASWRQRIEALPSSRPSLKELLGKDGSRFRIRTDAVKGHPRTWIRYVQPGGGTFTVELERGRVVDLDAQ